MGYFTNKNTFFGSDKGLYHRAKYGTANSTSSEKGTDNKLNNTSEYNAKYYQENKEKWSDNKDSTGSKKTKTDGSKSDNDELFYGPDGKPRFGHKDYDPNDPDFKRTDGTAIEGTGLRTFTNSNGSTIIIGNGIKFSFPPGTKITTAMAKKLAEVEKANDGSNKERYVAKMLNAVTGFADKQNLFGDEDKKETKKKSNSKAKKSASQEKTETQKKTDSNLRDWASIKKDYYSNKNKKKK